MFCNIRESQIQSKVFSALHGCTTGIIFKNVVSILMYFAKTLSCKECTVCAVGWLSEGIKKQKVA